MIAAAQCIKCRRLARIGRTIVVDDTHLERQFAAGNRQLVDQLIRILRNGKLTADTRGRRRGGTDQHCASVRLTSARKGHTVHARNTVQVKTGRNPQFHCKVISHKIGNLARSEGKLHAEDALTVLTDGKVRGRPKDRVGRIQLHIVIARRETGIIHRPRPRRIAAGSLAKGNVRSCQRQCIAEGSVRTRRAQRTGRKACCKQRPVINQLCIFAVIFRFFFLILTDNQGDITTSCRCSKRLQRKCFDCQEQRYQHCKRSSPTVPNSLSHPVLLGSFGSHEDQLILRSRINRNCEIS